MKAKWKRLICIERTIILPDWLWVLDSKLKAMYGIIECAMCKSTSWLCSIDRQWDMC